MMLELFAHPFSSYCQKALIACYENSVPVTLRALGPDHPEVGAELVRRWPFAKFPVLADGDTTIAEATSIIEYLAVHHPGSVALIPADPARAVTVRMLDRIFDNYVMSPVQGIVGDALRPPEQRSAVRVEEARRMLDTAYAWLEERLGTDGGWIAGDFSLADCAAAPALFYADWTHPIPDAHPALRAYRVRLLARPTVARVVDEARPYRSLFPLGDPKRD